MKSVFDNASYHLASLVRELGLEGLNMALVQSVANSPDEIFLRAQTVVRIDPLKKEPNDSLREKFDEITKGIMDSPLIQRTIKRMEKDHEIKVRGLEERLSQALITAASREKYEQHYKLAFKLAHGEEMKDEKN